MDRETFAAGAAAGSPRSLDHRGDAGGSCCLGRSRLARSKCGAVGTNSHPVLGCRRSAADGSQSRRHGGAGCGHGPVDSERSGRGGSCAVGVSVAVDRSAARIGEFRSRLELRESSANCAGAVSRRQPGASSANRKRCCEGFGCRDAGLAAGRRHAAPPPLPRLNRRPAEPVKAPAASPAERGERTRWLIHWASSRRNCPQPSTSWRASDLAHPESMPVNRRRIANRRNNSC